MANPSSSFTHKKRLFLFNKLDEVLKLWASGSGQGSFNFTVKNENPTLQYNLQLDMEDIRGTVPAHHRHQPPLPRHRGQHGEHAIGRELPDIKMAWQLLKFPRKTLQSQSKKPEIVLKPRLVKLEDIMEFHRVVMVNGLYLKMI